MFGDALLGKRICQQSTDRLIYMSVGIEISLGHKNPRIVSIENLLVVFERACCSGGICHIFFSCFLPCSTFGSI